MSQDLTPEMKKQLAARVNYYREMGIHDFYRQHVAEGTQVMAKPPAEAVPVVAAPSSSLFETPLPVIQDKPAALNLIREDIGVCSPFLMRQIEVIQPKVIVALGAVAAKNLLAINDSMANLRGRWYDFKGARLAVTYHPAYLLRDPRQKKETWKDLQMVMKYLGLTAPAKAQE